MIGSEPSSVNITAGSTLRFQFTLNQHCTSATVEIHWPESNVTVVLEPNPDPNISRGFDVNGTVVGHLSVTYVKQNVTLSDNGAEFQFSAYPTSGPVVTMSKILILVQGKPRDNFK